MQPSLDHSVAAERESKLLLGVAVGLGCVLTLCLLIAVVVVVLALFWTLQGQLGPGSSTLPATAALIVTAG